MTATDAPAPLPPFDEAVSGMAGPWLKGFARRLAPPSVSPDDLESEGLYAMWQAYQRLDGPGPNLDSYLIQAAKWHVLRVLNRRKWTGQDKVRAPRGVNSAGVVHADQVEQSYPDDVMREWHEVSAEDAAYGVADLADVRAEVREAVAALAPTQRDRLYRKFWLDESVFLSGNWWRDPRWGARAVLVGKLGHLQGCA
ncbi:sigma-70 family RNA polymerase sigma factor [Micromonospora sp. NBC_01699]|uniref:sigma-70 family RNA polymerase sigma factor n=1 Tax=Micromonospora sp. NBC_01699 TaxID=2975984 RepID=UPI002E2CF0BF|nr:sigma-70 family RNA polymerase sigma factor [Micromonospora sp. NBC_01699]